VWPVLGLAVLALLSRIPFHSSVLYTWDSVNYALGTFDFDVVSHRPHPPGYILYAKFGEALRWLTDDPNISLVWLSIIAGTMAVLVTYALARYRFGQTDGLVSGLLLLTSPLFWLYSEVALAYALEALFSVAIAYACYRTLDGSTRWIYATALVVGLAGGFRQTMLLTMGPVVLYAMILLPWRHRLGIGALVIALCLAWGVPLIASTGGPVSYLSAYIRLASIIEPMPAVDTIVPLFYGLHLMTPLLFGYLLGFLSVEDGHQRSWEKLFLLLWVGPGLLLCLFVHIGQPGYVLFALPPMCILTPPLLRGALARLQARWPTLAFASRDTRRRMYVITVLVLLAVGILTYALGTHRFIVAQEEHWGAMDTLPSQYAPSQTVVLTDLSWDSGFRLASYYMRDYPVYGFAIQEAKGPFKVSDPLLAAGWIFHSYQLQDNYDLDLGQHHFNKILNLPAGTKGLIVTHPALLPRTGEAAAGASLDESRVLILSSRLLYVALPEGARQLAVVDGRLEVR
jgi:hypothetical protein